MLETIKQAFEFIKYTLPETCLYIGQASPDEQSFQLHASYGFNEKSKLNEGRLVSGYQAASMNLMSYEEIIFDENDTEAQKLVSQFTYGLHVKSGISIPLFYGYGQWGALAVFSKSKTHFSQKDIEFVRSMAMMLSSTIRHSKEPDRAFQQAKNIAIAKKHWEIAIDSLPQLVIGLDNTGHIIRVNRTIETWGMGKVNEVKGLGISEFMKPICSRAEGFSIADWEKVWALIQKKDLIEKKVVQDHSGRTFQLTMRKVIDSENCADNNCCCAVLVIDDISTQQSVENYLKKQALTIEQRVEERTSSLRKDNSRLKHALLLQKRANIALKKMNNKEWDRITTNNNKIEESGIQ